MVMDERERQRRLRRRFGPPVEAAPVSPPAARRRARLPRWLLPGGVVLTLAAGALTAFLLLTPHQHVAPGCWWWTATRAASVVPGDRGCLRGYYLTGGDVAEGPGASDYALPIAYANPDQPVRRAACPFQPGDAVVVRYHAVFDDGRTIAVIDRCR